MSPRPQPLPPAQFVFEHLAVLAVSRMATVELCRVVAGETPGAVVAVKRLPPDYVEDPELQAMFRDEIWMASALRHPNIARVLGWGEDASGPYLVTEFVYGVSLARLMRTVFTTGEAFSERLIVFVMSSVCAGLAAAHSLRADTGDFLNMVHRDLTPGNILLGFDGEVKIVDFGLAKCKQRVTQTAIGITKGEPAYMSPEQVCGQQLDGRSDIFAVGVLLYELFAQHRPWSVTNVKEALDSIVEGPTPDLAVACPRIDRTLVDLVARCMAKKREDRVQHAADLKMCLDEWLRLHGYEDSLDHLARFVRRNGMRQMRWLDRALIGELEAGSSPFEASHDQPSILIEPPSEQRASAPPQPPPLIQPPPPVQTMLEESSQRLEEPEATTMRRERAATLTITAPPRSRQRDAAPPLGATGGHSILDVRPRARTHAMQPEELAEPIPLTEAYQLDDSATAVATEAEPSTQRNVLQSTGAMRNAAREMVGTARALELQARAAGEAAHRAAEKAEAAALQARSLGTRAEHAAEAVRLAAHALKLAAQGKRQEAQEALQRALAFHEAAAAEDR